jgi:hypothetical protein
MNMTRVWSDGEGPKLRPSYVAPEKAGTVLKRKKKTHHLDLDWAVVRGPHLWPNLFYWGLVAVPNIRRIRISHLDFVNFELQWNLNGR